MLKIITSLLDIIFPPRTEALLVRAAARQDTPALYRSGKAFGHDHVTHYSKQSVQALIKENKFHHNGEATAVLARLLEQWLRENHIESALLIPVPLGAQRLRERGYNQVTEVLSQLKSKQYVVDENILTRVHETRPQTSLKKEERLSNVIGAFSCSADQLRRHNETTIVIVDDVLTTGATLKAARASLAPHLPYGTTLHTVALAH